MGFLFSACEKLQVTKAEGLKLFTVDGVLLFDDDIQDEKWIEDQTIILSLTAPSQPELPKLASLKRQLTDDTLSISDSDVMPLSDVDSTPNSTKASPVLVVKVPTFSSTLHSALVKSGHKPCDSETWKRVSVS